MGMIIRIEDGKDEEDRGWERGRGQMMGMMKWIENGNDEEDRGWE